MDSLTQLATGAVLAAAVVPSRHRRAALAAGAALGTLPDLDVIPLSLLNDNPIIKMTVHRSITHSLLILPWVAMLIWWWFYKQPNSRVSQAPKRWWWAIFLALMTHPLLDCFNAYGTWLFWPLGEQALMWGNMFVIDPLFTLPLVIAVLWTACKPLATATQSVLNGALQLSMLYLAWTLGAQMYVTHKVDAQLTQMQLQDAPRLVAATPLNTLVWQVVVVTPDGILSGDFSLIQDDHQKPMAFTHIPNDVQALKAAQNLPMVQRLTAFNQGFQLAKVVDDTLIVSDVRMGRAPHYTFSFAVAKWENGTWQALNIPEQISNRPDTAQEWRYLKQRMFDAN